MTASSLILNRPAIGASAPSGGFAILPRPDLTWTPEVERATAHLYEKVKAVMPSVA